MSIDDVGGAQHRANQLLSGVGAKARAAKAQAPKVRGRKAAGAKVTADARPHFNAFSKAHVLRATELASEFMKIAEDTPGPEEEGVHAALAKAEEYVPTEPPGLVQHAVQLFATHDPTARRLIKLPSLEQRQPNLAISTGPTPHGATPPEDRMDYWREDPLLNEHHGHWHLVYPFMGRPSAGGVKGLGDRHGELFPYMHQQMLARYDAERLGTGLPRVMPLDPYRPMPQGYDPGPLEIWDGDSWETFRARPANASIGDLDPSFFAPDPLEYGSTLKDWDDARHKLTTAAREQVFHLPTGDVDVTLEDLGNTLEASVASVDWYGEKDEKNFNTYGDFHNYGHFHVMWYDNVNPFGVMGSFTTTSRDPTFWRHHKTVDGVMQAYRDNQVPHDFSKGPAARLVSIELTPSNSELVTGMVERPLASVSEDNVHTIRFLTHEDFGYEFRAENKHKRNQKVAVRMFLAPATQVEDRTAWIEMDRFLWDLKPGMNKVSRAAEESSVIRKPAQKAVDLTPTEGFTPDTGESGWCDCGWPYTLLLPRGTKEGMDFMLMAMLSAGADLQTPKDPNCTSISLCGLKDAPYPDKKPMGYPFDRALTLSVAETVAVNDNWYWRPIKIRCSNL